MLATWGRVVYRARWLVLIFVALLSRLRAGSDGFAVKVEAEGKEGGRYSCSAWRPSALPRSLRPSRWSCRRSWCRKAARRA